MSKLKKEEKRRLEEALIARWVEFIEGDTCFLREVVAPMMERRGLSDVEVLEQLPEASLMVA